MPYIRCVGLLVVLVWTVNTLYSGRKFSNCECGLHNTIENRIAGGWRTKPHELPWMVAIKYKGELFCGAAIINDRYILTAGHCVRWNERELMTVIIGQHSRLARDGVSIPVAKMILHENFYSHKSHDEADIALLKLPTPIQFSQKVSPVCLPRSNTYYENKYGTIAGWGMKSLSDPETNILRQTFVKLLSNADCAQTSMKQYVNDLVLCAYSDNKDACKGDSGGPLTFEREAGKSEIIGIVSFGKGCAAPNAPGIYTKVLPYLDWIYSHTQDAVWCRDN